MTTATLEATTPAPVPGSGSVSVWAGTGVVESVADLSGAIAQGRWVDAAVSAVGTGVDVAAAVSDPIGELLGAGLGWLVEHLDPLRGWASDLAGDATAVAGACATWQTLADQLDDAGHDLGHVLTADLDPMHGEAVTAYRTRAGDQVQAITALAGMARAIGTGLQAASVLVQIVHDLVVAALAKVVGAAISWATELVCSVGLATPWIIEQVTTRVASLTTHVATRVTGAITSTHALRDLIDQLTTTLGALTHHLHTATLGPTPRHTLDAGAPTHTIDDAAQPATRSTDNLMAVPAAPSPARSRRSRPASVEPGPLPSQRPVTRPSRAPDPDYTPRGRAEKPSAADRADKVLGLSGEEDTAQTMARAGFDVDQHPQTDGPKNPDFRIEGEIFDNYTPTSDSARNIWSGVQFKILNDQTERVVINLRDTGVSFDQLTQQFRYPIEGLLEVLVIDGGLVRPLYP